MQIKTRRRSKTCESGRSKKSGRNKQHKQLSSSSVEETSIPGFLHLKESLKVKECLPNLIVLLGIRWRKGVGDRTGLAGPVRHMQHTPSDCATYRRPSHFLESDWTGVMGLKVRVIQYLDV